MDETQRWLAEKRDLCGAAALCKALGEAGGLLCRTDDPAEYMRDLLIPLEWHCLVADRWGVYLATGDDVKSYETTPRAALSVILDNLETSESVLASWAANLVECYLKMGNTSAAELCAVPAYLGGDRSLQVLAVLHGASMEEGALASTAQLTREIQNGFPESPEGEFFRVRLLLTEGRRREAWEAARTGAANHSGYQPLWELYLDILLSPEDEIPREEALGAIPDGMAALPSLAPRLARAWLKAGNPEKAVEISERALGAGGAAPDITYLLGRALYAAGEDARAFEALKGLVENDAGRADALYLMALIALRNKKYDVALELAGSVAATEPALAVSAWLLASDAMRLAGFIDGALMALGEARSLGGADPALADEIGKREGELKKIK